MRIDDSNETDVYSKNKSKTADVVQGEKFVIKRPRKLKVPKITIQENAASSVPNPNLNPKPKTNYHYNYHYHKGKEEVAATKPADK
jgi:hypothetical protein